MPTKRDDAAYKAAYGGGRNDRRFSDKQAMAELGNWIDMGKVVGPDRYFGRLDGLTDMLAARGLCADVRDWWHKKPAGDELPW
ncbi:hypothetical protein E6C67_08560 [Azospirillum sp. TSA2s]|uniref:hypothetical protein n=1 Tax=Azospirillum sp. TSA2s TaxID=709810 RepID=UPI0010AA11D7|nr:hypothetical protein [Azospirillum sp. TSA2s]QCG93990.1 hypothetical protein E6C67_08560 [Azospirillum sp. TSA2s]